jgi:PAS domain S-box-containing protein
MRRRLGTVRGFFFAAALLVLILDVALTAYNLRVLIRGSARMRQGRETIVEVERALSMLKDAETGQRGYLLTGDPSYLAPHAAATGVLDQHLDRLAVLTSAEPAQQARVARLRTAIEEKCGELDQTIAFKRQGQTDRAVAIVKSGRGKRAMDEARALVAELTDHERQGLARLQVRLDAAGGWTFLTLFAVTALAIVLLLASWFLARRERAERERAGHALAERKAWLSTTLASIGDAVIVTDGRGRVQFINPVATALTGWSEADATGRPLDEVFPIVSELTREPVESPVERVLREGVIVGLGNHTILRARDGTERPIDDSAAPVRSGSEPISGVVLVFRDVTDRRRLEAERETLLAAERTARAESESANRAKDQFLAVLSHELRTPLNPVLLAVTEMLGAPSTPRDMHPTLEMIREYVKLEARLVDDLLDVMRIASGKMSLEWSVADCHALINHAAHICRSDADAKSVPIALELAADECHLNADSARMQQALWNLVKNAVKFTPAGGKVTIRTRNEPGDDQAKVLVVEVIDTGIGIDPESMARIFDPFQQGEPSVARRFGGLGLGLAISRGVIEAHGGQLVGESKGAGHGSLFRIRLRALPRPQPPERSEPPSPTSAAPEHNLRILLVEDEPATLRLLTRLLRARGHEVVAASTLADALASAAQNHFDLVVSDVGLPDGSGLDLMHHIAANGRVPGIALTGYGMEEDIRRSREAGFTAHMTKPIDFTKLDDAICQIMAGAKSGTRPITSSVDAGSS